MDELADILNAIDNALHLPDLARDLGILSKILYIRQNCHRKFKYFQAFKQIQTVLKKFSALKLRRTAKQELSASAKKRGKDVFLTSFAALLHKGFMYMEEAERLCKIALPRCLELCNLFHSVELHMILMSIASRVFTKAIEIKTTIRERYEQLHRITKKRSLDIPDLPRGKSTTVAKKAKKRKLKKTENLLQNLFKDNGTDSPVAKKTFLQKNSNQSQDLISLEPSTDEGDNKADESKLSFLSSIQAIFAASNFD